MRVKIKMHNNRVEDVNEKGKFPIPKQKDSLAKFKIFTKMEFEVPTKDVVKLMLQFLRENGLKESAETLERESGVRLNAVPDLDALCGCVVRGEWPAAVACLSKHGCQLPQSAAFALWTEVLWDLHATGDSKTAFHLLTTSEPLTEMCRAEPSRWEALKEHISTRATYSAEESRQRREELATVLRQCIGRAEASRLLSLLTQAIEFQQLTGLLRRGQPLDLLQSDASLVAKSAQLKECDSVPRRNTCAIGFTESSRPAVACFSDQWLVTGSRNGAVQMWDFESGKQLKALQMDGGNSVQSLCFSEDFQLLAAGDDCGNLKVWRVFSSDSRPLLQVSAHSSAITQLVFDRDGSQLLSASVDASLRVLGLRSKQLLKELKGHDSFVNDCVLVADDSFVASVSSDGSLRLWDARTQQCVAALRSDELMGAEAHSQTLAVKRILVFRDPHSTRKKVSQSDAFFETPESECKTHEIVFFVLCDSPQIAIVCFDPSTAALRCVGHFKAKSDASVVFTDMCLSPNGRYLNAVASNCVCFTFDTKSRKIKGALKMHSETVLGIAIHPHFSALATFGTDNTLKIWK